MRDLSLTGHSSLGTVIDEFLTTIGSAPERRDLRSALSHVSAELGTMPVRAVRARHLVVMIDKLHAAGLSARRELAVLDALSELFAFAVARGLVPATPMPTPPPRERRLPPLAAPPPVVETARTPTMTMIALGARVAAWTAWLMSIGFALLLLALVIELA
jgi:site-specific recombinase XerC